jgi:hypothetical protein
VRLCTRPSTNAEEPGSSQARSPLKLFIIQVSIIVLVSRVLSYFLGKLRQVRRR